MPTRGRSKRRKSCGTVTQTLERVSVEISFEHAQNSGSTQTSWKEPCQQQFSPSAILHTHNTDSALSHCYSPSTNQDQYPCGESFATPQTQGLRQRCHNREILLSCTQCSKSFSGQANYRRHILVHTGERPHCCPVCSRGFSQMGNLQRHMKIHSRTRASPAPALLLQSEVNEHLKLGECEERKSFFSLDQEGQDSSAMDSSLAEILAPLRSELNRIGLIAEHEGSSPTVLVLSNVACGNSELEQPAVGLGKGLYNCPKCSRQFTCKSHLNRHWKVHTGERPYSCPVCGRKFNQESNCQRHQQLHLHQGRLNKRGSLLLVDTGIVGNQTEGELDLGETCRAAESLCKLSLDELNMGGEETKERDRIAEDSMQRHQSATTTATCQNLDSVTEMGQEIPLQDQQCFVSLQGNTDLAQQDPLCGISPPAQLTQNCNSFSLGRADGQASSSTVLIDSDRELTTEIGIKGIQESERGKEIPQMPAVDVSTGDRTEVCVSLEPEQSDRGAMEACEEEMTEKDDGTEGERCRRGEGEIMEKIDQEREQEEVCLNTNEPQVQTINCPLCGLAVSTLSCLEQHLKTQHPNVVITLDVLSPGVNSSVKAIGTSVSDTQCLHCGRNFSSRSNLKKHMLVHSGRRPYSCPDCGQTFNQSGNVLRHQRSHHHGHHKASNQGEATMTSQRKTRKSSQRLRVTRKESTDPEGLGNAPAGQSAVRAQFLCYMCGRGFLSQDSLEIHEQGHRKERPYRCPHCNRGFAHVQNFSRHLLVHTGEKPWHCSDCGRCFNQASNLNRHCRTQGHQGAAAEHTGE
ncbi:zinc finger protein 892-like [Conger conger]|uniref:zinc finger protein 892-like n=1 Tax=Conger conger TaxID=82655 RepID=UPI002A5AEA67|nr:zinc finger protein 892-like [Conger conger]XP_061114118.1 zinc finger protein 892-like [Conger conger]XP_061114127.1 zinc finger protein 892-like [Conger conger]XP_061114136.1 zinc finger protein 892-like [Conger conger]